jgi:hypothetical protein
MKNFITTTMALLALTVAANATDLPSKTKAPAAPAPVAAPAPAASNDSLTVTYGQDLGNNFGAKVDDAYGVTYKHNLGAGFSVSGAASTTQAPNALLKQNLEAQVGYALPAFSGIAVSGKAGIGERFVDTGNFPYFALYGNADYKVMDGLTLNAVQYRYRSAIDTGTYGYQSHRLGTGVTYDITPTYSVSATVYRSFDTSSSFNATGDAFALGLTAKF